MQILFYVIIGLPVIIALGALIATIVIVVKNIKTGKK